MRKPSAALDGISAILLDMDGVLYNGDRPVKGAARAVERFRDEGKKLIFFTNNSAYTRREHAKKLTQMGISAREHNIVTSGYVTAVYLRKRSPHAKIYVVGEKGLKSELRRAGLKLVSRKDAEKATHVVAGLDRELDYSKIAGGLRALSAGAEFIATNMDAAYPSDAGLLPGAGATVGALVGCAGRKPDLVTGKPSPHIINMGLTLLNTKPSKTAIVGDRIDTDVEAGKKSGLRTILVLSGVCTEKDVKKIGGTGMAPDFVFGSIGEVIN
ncbi:MAG TPA: HAD-IIA family hydrolase [Hadesarchaea archaeon]|nr:HAD-IIA family hydrolase [Hadesarchaea archaeon]